jgi:hypothetical protein
MVFRHPGPSLIIVLTLELGIGPTFAIFSVVNGALYKGLPFPEADRLMVVGRTNPAHNIDFTFASVHDLVDWSEQQTTFEGLSALSRGTVDLTGADRHPERFVPKMAFPSADSRTSVYGGPTHVPRIRQPRSGGGLAVEA